MLRMHFVIAALPACSGARRTLQWVAMRVCTALYVYCPVLLCMAAVQRGVLLLHDGVSG